MDLVYIHISKHQHFKLCFGSESWARLFLTTNDISTLGICLWILFMTHEAKLSLAYYPTWISPSGPLRITYSFPQTSLNSSKPNKQLLSASSGSSKEACFLMSRCNKVVQGRNINRYKRKKTERRNRKKKSFGWGRFGLRTFLFLA